MTSPGGTFIHYAGKKQPPDQAERRKNVLVNDQHGRRIHLVWDVACRGVVGFYPQFSAPWMPEIKYHTVHAENGFPESVEWEYRRMLEDNQTEWANWYDDLRRYGARMPGVDAMKAYDAALKGEWEQVPKALLIECGSTPQHADLIKGAMAGNKWVLGFSTVVPDWAKPIVNLWDLEAQKRSSAVSEAELDRFRDADGPDEIDPLALEEEVDPAAVGGKRVPVKEPKKGGSRRPVSFATKEE